MLMVFHLKTNKYIKIVSFLLFLICIKIYLDISQSQNFIIGCPIEKITGFYCPGCGITRMFISLFNLDFYQAFRYNPLVFILLILLIIKLVVELFTDKFKKYFNTKFYILLLSIVIIFGIIRNISIFDFLAPTII